MRASSTPSQAQPWWPDGDESQGQRLPTVACAVDASRRLGVHVFPPASWVKMAGGGMAVTAATVARSPWPRAREYPLVVRQRAYMLPYMDTAVVVCGSITRPCLSQPWVSAQLHTDLPTYLPTYLST